MTTAPAPPPCTTAVPDASLAPDETTVASFDAVAFECGAGAGAREWGEGRLTCTSSRIIWLPSSGAPGLSIPVPSIALHAVAADRDGRPPAIVCLLDDGGCDGGEEDEGAGDVDQPSSSPELRFVPDPSSATTVDAIFAALCECAALNPDPSLAEEDADGAGEWLTAAAALEAAAGGADPLSRLPADALDALLESRKPND